MALSWAFHAYESSGDRADLLDARIAQLDARIAQLHDLGQAQLDEARETNRLLGLLAERERGGD